MLHRKAKDIKSIYTCLLCVLKQSGPIKITTKKRLIKLQEKINVLTFNKVIFEVSEMQCSSRVFLWLRPCKQKKLHQLLTEQFDLKAGDRSRKEGYVWLSRQQ